MVTYKEYRKQLARGILCTLLIGACVAGGDTGL